MPRIGRVGFVKSDFREFGDFPCLAFLKTPHFDDWSSVFRQTKLTGSGNVEIWVLRVFWKVLFCQIYPFLEPSDPLIFMILSWWGSLFFVLVVPEGYDTVIYEPSVIRFYLEPLILVPSAFEICGFNPKSGFCWILNSWCSVCIFDELSYEIGFWRVWWFSTFVTPWKPYFWDLPLCFQVNQTLGHPKWLNLGF